MIYIKAISCSLILLFVSCNYQVKKSEINCTDSYCECEYVGPEFRLYQDIAHQFSNKISERVGEKLKEMYKKQKYVRVDFSNIAMSTAGMGTGCVTYKAIIPFVSVKDKCEAYTSFDHVGGWNHEPALSGRKAQLKNALLKNDKLDISSLKVTKEGLQEYWIQWRNKEIQQACEKQ